jgi:spermidine/putrescine transport system permease protein
MAKGFSIRSMPGFTAIAIATFVFLYLPILTMAAYAFNSGQSIASWEGFSLRWFAAAWENEDVKDAATRSMQIAVIAASIATVCATMAAIATTRTKPYRGLTFKFAFINQPLMVPEIVTAIALLIVFAKIKIWTGYTGIGYVMAAHSAFCIPFAYMPIRARLENMDLTLERAASDLYATPWQAFKRVTFPLLWPGILSGYMLAFVISLDDVVITNLIKSGGQETLPTYMLGLIRRVATPEINAISVVFLMLSVLVVTIFFFVNKKKI